MMQTDKDFQVRVSSIIMASMCIIGYSYCRSMNNTNDITLLHSAGSAMLC